MTVEPFTYDALPQRVLFGPGRRRELVAEVDRIGASRLFVIAGGAAKIAGDELVAALGSSVRQRWNEVAQHVPVELAERASAAAIDTRADAVVSIGGGSAIGLAKAIALSHSVPILAVPTTYAGSEQTTVYGLTAGRHKQTGRAAAVLPRVVIYDPELTIGLPVRVTAPSAFNALAHAVEALYAPGHNPVTSVLALEAVRAIHSALPDVIERPADLRARGELLYGAYLAGMALGATAPGLHHKLSHVLGGTFNLVHADTHSVLLPHAVAFNARVLPVEMALLAESLDAVDGDAAGALWDLAVASHVPTSLATLGLPRDALAEVAELASAEIVDNPRPFTTADLSALLERAYDGHRPEPPERVSGRRGGPAVPSPVDGEPGRRQG